MSNLSHPLRAAAIVFAVLNTWVLWAYLGSGALIWAMPLGVAMVVFAFKFPGPRTRPRPPLLRRMRVVLPALAIVSAAAIVQDWSTLTVNQIASALGMIVFLFAMSAWAHLELKEAGGSGHA